MRRRRREEWVAQSQVVATALSGESMKPHAVRAAWHAMFPERAITSISYYLLSYARERGLGVPYTIIF